MINIAKLLKDAPEGMKLYSPLLGEVEFAEVMDTDYVPIRVMCGSIGERFDEFGRYKGNEYPNAECLLFPSKDCRTWEGWKAPVEHKFKVGDWVVFNNSHNSIYQISEIRDSYYMLTHTRGGSMPLQFSQENFLRLWTIQDAKDGDVLVSGTGNPFIYNGNIEFSSAGAYIGVSQDGKVRLDMFPSKGWTNIKNVKPATQEQHDLLFTKIKEIGYQWGADKKELRKILPHYDIANFKPKQWVLVRDDDEWEWALTRFSHLSNGSTSVFICINGASFQQCIPFDGNENLLGTTDMPSEEYINW